MSKYVFGLALLLILDIQSTKAQRLNPRGFTERRDTLIVQSAGVVLFGLSESVILHAFDSARTAEDSEAVSTGIDDYRWYQSTSQKSLDRLRIPNVVTASRYIWIAQGSRPQVFDRHKMVGPEGVEEFDAVVTDGRGGYRFLTNFQLGDPQALAEVKKLLNKTGS